MNTNYKWNGVSLSQYGIVVEKVPKIPKGKKKIDVYEIEGRNGFITIDNGVYEPFLISLECHVNTNSSSLDTIKRVLDGYGTLSIDGQREYTAIIQNQIDFEKVIQCRFRKFLIQFLCNPISHDIESTEIEIETNPATIEIIDATANMYPVITLKGTGDINITVNNKTFNLIDLDASKTYTLDCENKVIVDDNLNNVSNKMLYDFPYLIPGENTVSYLGTLSEFKIEYKKAYL